MPVGVMSGIGPRTQRRLSSLGIHTLGDLAHLDDATAHDILGSYGPLLVRRARGIDDRPVCQGDPVKSVSNERTFAEDVRDRHEVESALGALSARVGRRLRRKGLSGRTVVVKVRFSDFTPRTIQRTLSEPTNDETTIGSVARELANQVWSPGIGLRLLGVGVSGFAEQAEQMGLFAEEGEERVAAAGADTSLSDAQTGERRSRLVHSIDSVRERFGDDALRSGRELQARPAAPASFSPSERDEESEDGG